MIDDAEDDTNDDVDAKSNEIQKRLPLASSALSAVAANCVSASSSSSTIAATTEEIVVGQTVIAPFKGNKYHPARVLDQQAKRFFQIYFDDGTVSRFEIAVKMRSP